MTSCTHQPKLVSNFCWARRGEKKLQADGTALGFYFADGRPHAPVIVMPLNGGKLSVTPDGYLAHEGDYRLASR